jgi:prohibitin 2
MNRSGGEAFARLAQQLNRARMQASGGGKGSGGNPFQGIPGGGRGAATGGGVLAVLVIGGVVLNYSLFNGKFGLNPICLMNRH